ncbi:adenosylcobinamide-phosphate synthase [Palleronia aestuarii]|uniref:Cobalamin biosynthesis protein CobD n=1 Tax=Palleronia aestuarii TaxID=568105 RepID=A0A2W7QBG9_9RHOB|nr:adenosylcobinamide-phosphate synthase CbiB [Palleronia aestuarii]PZX19089.1 adenosylcobinamide-phosphate synthase [Palleronia aestuarii]
MILLAALLLDAAFGEPRAIWSRAPHPAILMGRLVAAADRRFNRAPARRNGVLITAALVAGAAFLGLWIEALPGGGLVSVLLGAILLAQRSLADHVADVATALRRSLPEGREAVARIVGRDTAAMDATAIARGAIESAAENLSDAVVAPAFWFLVAGLPGLLVYKLVNTADSMVGYRTPRHEQFGWAAARLDDVLNWVPARLTAALLALSHARPDAWRVILRDGPLHRSPNAGWPEAAMAFVLGIALSGPRAYDGEMRDFPYVHPEGRREIGADEIEASVRALWRAWTALVVIVIVLLLA